MHHDLTIPGHPEVFVAGDNAAFTPEGGGEILPGVAQTAMQMGRYAGLAIAEEIRGGRAPAQTPRAAFRYRDKGAMAIIGKNHAIADINGLQVTGFVAWMLWAVVHIAFLVGFRNRLRVLFDWAVRWFADTHDARIILGNATTTVSRPQGPGFVPTEG